MVSEKVPYEYHFSAGSSAEHIPFVLNSRSERGKPQHSGTPQPARASKECSSALTRALPAGGVPFTSARGPGKGAWLCGKYYRDESGAYCGR